MSNPICVACQKPIQAQQVRLTLSHDAGGGGRHTKGAYVHLTCHQAYERLHEWLRTHREKATLQAIDWPERGTTNYSVDAVGREGGKASTETRS